MSKDSNFQFSNAVINWLKKRRLTRLQSFLELLVAGNYFFYVPISYRYFQVTYVRFTLSPYLSLFALNRKIITLKTQTISCRNIIQPNFTVGIWIFERYFFTCYTSSYLTYFLNLYPPWIVFHFFTNSEPQPWPLCSELSFNKYSFPFNQEVLTNVLT